MPFIKTACAPVLIPELGSGQWQDTKSDIVCSQGVCKLGARRVKTAEKAIRSYSTDKYLLSHVSIMASVDTEPGANPNVTFPDYKVTPQTAQYMNNNADSWEKKLLLSTFKTFIGSENYVEHCQNPLLSKGKIIDAVSREVPVYDPVTGNQLRYANGEPVTTVYVDILVATSREYQKLVESIQRGETNAMSMGCLLKYTICTECGKVIYRDVDACDHIRFNKGGTHVDENGITRITTELCGHASDPSSCEFIEASWVAIPAFRGAVRRNVLNLDERKIAGQLKTAFDRASARFHEIYKIKNVRDMNQNKVASLHQERLLQMNDQIIPERILELVRWV